MTSTLTVWSLSGEVMTVPWAAIRVNRWSRATCQRTGIDRPRPLPGVATGCPGRAGGVARVQMMTESAVGSPLAIP